MELIPASDDYETVSDRVRRFSAIRLSELIEGIRPFVAEALSDPAGMWDVEPGRLQAHAALIKLQVSMVKELGSLYRVTMPPPAEVPDVEMVSADRVEELLAAERERAAELVAAATEAGIQAGMRAAERLEQLSLEAARSRVAAALEGMKRG